MTQYTSQKETIGGVEYQWTLENGELTASSKAARYRAQQNARQSKTKSDKSTQTATLYKIDDLKASRNGDVAYKRLYFRLQDGNWAATDVVPSYRNFKNWKPVLESGIDTIIKDFYLKAANKIDADSPIIIVGKAQPKPEQQTLL